MNDIDPKEQLRQQLDAYRQGKLPPEEVEALRRRFESNPYLREAMIDYQIGRYVDGDLPDREVEDLTHRIHEDPLLRTAMIEYQLSRYVDGELSQQEIGELTSRIEREPNLQTIMDQYQHLDEKLLALHDRFRQDEFSRQRNEILSKVDRHMKWRRWVLNPLILILILAVGIFFYVRARMARREGGEADVTPIVVPATRPDERPEPHGPKDEPTTLPDAAD